MENVLIGIAGILALLGALAFIVEAVVELVVASWLPWVLKDTEKRMVILKLISSAFGVAITILFGIDLFGAVVVVFDIEPVYGPAAVIFGQVLTGLLMGRGAQWFHDIGMTWLGLDGRIVRIPGR